MKRPVSLHRPFYHPKFYLRYQNCSGVYFALLPGIQILHLFFFMLLNKVCCLEMTMFRSLEIISPAPTDF